MPGAWKQPKNIIILLADGAAPRQWDFGKHLQRLIGK
jgi:hypothetical protein